MLWGESKRRVALKNDQKEGTKTCAQIQAIYSLQHIPVVLGICDSECFSSISNENCFFIYSFKYYGATYILKS